ncbi:hypothetical protein [Anaeromusa sp.]|uniref:hypothetical protein n=1 Tax=Anaeromusa sp. TaxID=1872520 RepID=UPI002633BDCE|nr:hypothetical protein [Anaeromusa sp.]MDD3157010.1 hypothetical protein [Anaeromusa sp.]
MDLTNKQQESLVNYLKAKREFNRHVDAAKIGWSSKMLKAVKDAAKELKNHFSEEEYDFLTSAAYFPELENHFLGGK